MSGSADSIRNKWAKRSRRTLLGGVALGITLGLLPQSAMAITKPTPGPSGSSAAIRDTHGGLGTFAPLRYGNNSYGYQHILIGGSTRNTENHEVNSFAQKQWDYAIGGGTSIAGRFSGSRLYVTNYNTPGGRARTMCVVVDNNDLVFGNKNYGQKGIITAYWVSGHMNPNLNTSIRDKCD